jgi:hypothetical protein
MRFDSLGFRTNFALLRGGSREQRTENREQRLELETKN